MAKTFANLLTSVKSRIRADLAVPVVNDLHDDNVEVWADEKAPLIIHLISDPVRLTLLYQIDIALAGNGTQNDAAYFTLPGDFEKPLAVRVTGSEVTLRDSRLVAPNVFSKYDSQNFITAPSEQLPVTMFADKVWCKPNTITAGRIDYVKNHPGIESNGTKFDGFGDYLLQLKLLEEYYGFIENERMVAKVVTEFENLIKMEEVRLQQKTLQNKGQ